MGSLPRQLGKYEVLDQLGVGGMAVVYRARDTILDRLVALKVMHPHLRDTQQARIRFAREARTVAKLRHPNILEIYDYSAEDDETDDPAGDHTYIVTELLTGPTLRDFADAHRDMPAEVAASFGLQLARALSYAHAQGVIHRDIKPENVLLHEQKAIKLTDFGIAHMMDGQSFTATGQVLGSPSHIAPEHIEGQVCDVRSDIFSLGTLIYFLAVGELPFAGNNPHQVLNQIMEGRFIEPLRMRPTVGPALNTMIIRCLARQPEDRYPCVDDLVAELEAFLESMKVGSAASLLQRYISDPDNETKTLNAHVVEQSIVLGEGAARRRRTQEALVHFNRALAIVPGDAKILERIHRLGQGMRRRRWLPWAMAAVVLLALSSVSAWSWLNHQDGDRVQPLVPVAEVVSDSATRTQRPAQAVLGTPPLLKRRQMPTLVSVSLSSSPPSVSSSLAAGSRPAASASNTRTPASTTASPAIGNVDGGLRRVIFKPNPPNVQISVDGGVARSFGPSFRSVQLSPGTHRFRFIGAHNCCVDEAFSVTIPNGSEPYVLQKKLRFKPARLYVIAPVPADVQVGDGIAKGRSRYFISVPMHRKMVESYDVRVSASGYRAFTRKIRLQAGEVTQLRAELLPAS